MPMEQDRNMCFIFEIISPKHVIIVRYTTNDLVLHGARDLKSLREVQPEPIAQKYNWRVVQEGLGVRDLPEFDAHRGDNGKKIIEAIVIKAQ